MLLHKHSAVFVILLRCYELEHLQIEMQIIIFILTNQLETKIWYWIIKSKNDHVMTIIS